MKDFFKELKKHWITVWLVAAVLAVGAFVVFAAYTGIYSVKRVVSTTASSGMLFSSNSMETFATTIEPRHITTSQSSGSYTYNLTVNDFSQSDLMTRYVSANGLVYTLTAQLCVKLNGSYYPISDTEHVSDAIRTHAASIQFDIQYASDGGTDVSASNAKQSLSGGDVITYTHHVILPSGNGTNKYAITFDEYELADVQEYDYYVKLKAEPLDSSSLEPIACYLYLTKSLPHDSAWTGRLQETSNLASYDAYNYIIEGSGEGTVTVRWNSAYIDINEIFLANNSLTVVTEDKDANGNVYKHFELSVGHADDDGVIINRYELQLYKNNGNGDYSNVPNWISCAYVADPAD